MKFLTLFISLFLSLSTFPMEDIECSNYRPVDKSICTVKGDAVLEIGCTKFCVENYVRSLKLAAAHMGVKIHIESVGEPNTIAKYDGLVSPGGHDIHPEFYTKSSSLTDKKVDKIFDQHARLGNRSWDYDTISDEEKDKREVKRLARDKKELNILDHYYSDETMVRTPYLGICYGMQVMGAYHDVPLYVDITEDLGIQARRRVLDEVISNGKGEIVKYMKGDKWHGYKNHHQGLNYDFIKKNKNKIPFTVTSTSHDGKIVESVENMSVERPYLGIQFHAENMKNSCDVQLGPYVWFIEKACQNKNYKLAKSKD